MIQEQTLRKLARGIEAILAFVGSYAVSVTLLSFLLILTFLGTIAQANHGLFWVQNEYFNSVFFMQPLLGPVSIPLPGGYLLMLLLFNNLLVGGIIRAPFRWRYPGMLIAHGGILFLLFGGFVAHHFSLNGGMQLYEGDSSNLFSSYHDWAIEVCHYEPDGKGAVYEVPQRDLDMIRRGGSRRFTSDRVPFDVTVSAYFPNCIPRVAHEGALAAAVDGFYLQPIARADENERNMAGAYVTLTNKDGGRRHSVIVWGRERAPYVTTINNERWSVAMVRQRWSLPFSIRLDTFTVELHPNTGMAKVFLSDVTKREGDAEEQIKITMNEPFRYRGYTLFQSSWGPVGAPEGSRLYSGFAVVKNPVDHWPLYACIIVSLGLLLHFCQRLVAHLREGHVSC